MPFRQTLRSAGLQMQLRRQCPGWKILTILGCMVTAAAAAQSGDFIYTDNGTDVTITGYAVGAPPEVSIPATIVISENPLVEKTVVSIGTGIGTGPFEGRAELTSVAIPSGVTSIGSRAFYDCTNVTSVTLPSGLTSIGTYSFYNCRALPGIAIPPSVTSIGRNAFSYCIALTSMSLPTGVTSIGIETFLRCGALSNITIPATVASIGFGAFSYCSALTSVVIPSGVTSIAGSTFYSCSGMTSVTLPSAITSIGTFAFQYCSGLTSVTIPSSLTSLTNKVFANCRSLTTVAIPASVTTIHAAAFAECSSLTSFTVAAGNPNFNSLNGLLTNLGQTKLITCPGGVSGNFTIPTGLIDIDIQAFRLCGELTGVTFHSGVLSIGSQAFSTCAKLKHAVFMGNPPSMGSGVFETPATGFTIYYLNNLTWPITPASTWLGYPAVYIAAITPVFNWLLAKGLPGNSNLQSDMNGDGINLLMAYALNLEPNAFSSPPQPVLDGNQMSLSFHAGVAGVTYTVKCSEDMQNWSTTGVTLSDPDGNQVRTATVDVAGPKCFMRLEVSY